MEEQKPQECVFEYLKKGLEKSFEELREEYGSEGIPNTPEIQEKLKDITSEILKGER